MRALYNTHVHIFTSECVPPGFYGRENARFARKITLYIKFRRLTLWLLQWINPFNLYDKGDRLARLIQTGGKESQEEIFQELLDAYHDFPKIRFIVLPIDFDFMAGGEPLMSYATQLHELISMKAKYQERLQPFVCADPRRAQGQELLEFVRPYLKKYGFAGIKLYPALGFYPFDPALFELYDYAQQYHIPIITHCDIGGISYQGDITAQHTNPQHVFDHPASKHSNTPRHSIIPNYKSSGMTTTQRAVFIQNFSAPNHFIDVLKEFPRLKICFAHFGGSEQIALSQKGKKTWFTDIVELIRANENVYTDISYTLSDEKVFESLAKMIASPPEPGINKKILFGTDYFMVSRKKKEDELVRDFKSKLDEKGTELFMRIASDNPSKFLENTLVDDKD